MRRIPSLTLPAQRPSPAAIKSCKNNEHDYEPEFWEFHYDINRYLERVDSSELIQRYSELIKNLRSLSSKDRDIIPIQSFLSSWYWFCKEHQTRYEFYLRGEKVPEAPPEGIVCNEFIDAPARPRSPNAGDILFRYSSQEHINSLVSKGHLRIFAASKYSELEGDKAREDDELSKHAYTPGANVKIKTQDGIVSPIIGDMKHTVSIHNYYTYCVSCDWDSELQREFGGACAIIKNVKEFSRRLNRAANKLLEGWYFHNIPVEYYDPYDMPRRSMFEPSTSKNFRFAYQREYRFLWIHMGGLEASGYLDLDLGCLDDILEIPS